MKNRSIRETWGDSPAPKGLESVKLDVTSRESCVTRLINVAPADREQLTRTAGQLVKALKLYFGVQIIVLRDPLEPVRVRGKENKVRDAVNALNEMYVAPRKRRIAEEEEKERELNRARERMMGEMKKRKIEYAKHKASLAG